MKKQSLMLALVAAAMLTACTEKSTADADRDIAKSAAKRLRRMSPRRARKPTEQVNEAKQKLDAAQAEATAEVAKANATAGEKINAATADATSAERAASKDLASVQSDAFQKDAKARYDLTVAKAEAGLQGRCRAMHRAAVGPAGQLQGLRRSPIWIRPKARATKVRDDAESSAKDLKN